MIGALSLTKTKVKNNFTNRFSKSIQRPLSGGCRVSHGPDKRIILIVVTLDMLRRLINFHVIIIKCQTRISKMQANLYASGAVRDPAKELTVHPEAICSV